MYILIICSHNKYYMPSSSDSSDLSIISKVTENSHMAILLLFYFSLSTFSPVLQVLRCPLMPRRHPLLSISCPAICYGLLIATSTLSRRPHHGCVHVHRGRIASVILNLWIRWSEWPALSPVDLHPGESPPGCHGMWCSVDTRAGLDALKERKLSYQCRKIELQFLDCLDHASFFGRGRRGSTA